MGPCTSSFGKDLLKLLSPQPRPLQLAAHFRHTVVIHRKDVSKVAQPLHQGELCSVYHKAVLQHRCAGCGTFVLLQLRHRVVALRRHLMVAGSQYVPLHLHPI